MKSIASIFIVRNLNPPVDKELIKRIESAPIDTANPHLSLLYFYGMNELGQDKIVRVWFYSSRTFREQELANIRLHHPHIPIV